VHSNLCQLLLPLAGCFKRLLLLPLSQQLPGAPAALCFPLLFCLCLCSCCSCREGCSDGLSGSSFRCLLLASRHWWLLCGCCS
jgi:hypothetical protein